MAPGAVVAENRQHDLRLVAPDDPDDVLEQDVFGPEAQGLVERAGVAEVESPAEVLPRAVDAPRRQQLVAPDDAELEAELGAGQVLPPFAAREGEIGRLPPVAARDAGEGRGVFVVGVGADHQQAPVLAELGERAVDRLGPAGGRRLERRRQDVGPGGAEGHGSEGRQEREQEEGGRRERAGRRAHGGGF